MSKPEEFKVEDFKYIEVGYVIPEINNFSRNHFGTREIVYEKRKERNNTGIYRTSFWYDSLDPYDSSLLGDFYIDFDSEEDIELAREDLLFVIWKLHLKQGFGLPMEAFRIYFSGKKGFHLIIPIGYLGVEPSKDLDKIYKWIGQDLHADSVNQTVDLAVYERRRLFRLENSIHPDTGLYKIPMHYEEVVNLSVDEILELAKTNRRIKFPEPYLVPSANEAYKRYINEYNDFLEFQRNRPKKSRPMVVDGKPPEAVQNLIDLGPVKGTRNETVAALTSYWKNQGHDKDEIFDLLMDWNQGEFWDNRDPRDEIENTMNSILSRDLNYGINRFKALAEGDVGGTYDREEYKEFKKGRYR